MKLKEILVRKSVFFNIILCFAVFIVAFSLLMAFIGITYSHKMRKDLVKQHTEALKVSSDVVDEDIQKTLAMTNILVHEKSIYDIFYNADNDVYTDVSKVRDVVDTLTIFNNTGNLAVEAAIVDRKHDIVYSANGKFSIDNYFSSDIGYTEYDADYWRTKSVPFVGYEVLKPSEHTLVNHSVLPLVASGFKGSKTGQLLIIDINADALAKSFYTTGMTESSNIFIYNTDTGVLLGEDEFSESFFNNERFIKKLNERDSFSYIQRGKKYLIVKTEGSIGRNNDYYYVSIVPVSDLLKGFNHIVGSIWLISLLFIALISVLAYYMSKRLYDPIKGLYNLVSGNSNASASSNEIEVVRLRMQDMIDNDSSLRLQLQTMLPLICAQKLRGFLDSMEEDEDTTELEHVLNQNGIDFNDDNFVVAVIKLKYSERFYSDFNNEQYLQVKSAIGVIFEAVLSTEYRAYVISDKKDEYILIINVPDNKEAYEYIINEIKNAQESFKYDNDYLTINIAVGTSNPGYEGMKRSYTEGRSISMLQNPGKSGFDVYTGAQQQSRKYEYTMEDESRLFHCMIKGDAEETIKIVNDITQKNIESGINRFNVRMLYQQFYNTAIRVLHTKNISEKELMEEKYVDINANFERIDLDDMAEYIRLLVREAAEYTQITATRVDMDGVIEYIDNNFTQDIYLENIAKEFNTTSKYLSKLLKQRLGVGFGAYLSSLRIEKVKKMLIETDKKINDIYVECGFYSRNTFIRTFKNLVGVLPSEYRKMSKNGEGGEDNTPSEDEE